MDMDHHAGGVDIGDFEMEAFVKPEAAGVYGGKIGIVLEGFNVARMLRTSSRLRMAGRRH